MNDEYVQGWKDCASMLQATRPDLWPALVAKVLNASAETIAALSAPGTPEAP